MRMIALHNLVIKIHKVRLTMRYDNYFCFYKFKFPLYKQSIQFSTGNCAIKINKPKSIPYKLIDIRSCSNAQLIF